MGTWGPAGCSVVQTAGSSTSGWSSSLTSSCSVKLGFVSSHWSVDSAAKWKSWLQQKRSLLERASQNAQCLRLPGKHYLFNTFLLLLISMHFYNHCRLSIWNYFWVLVFKVNTFFWFIILVILQPCRLMFKKINKTGFANGIHDMLCILPICNQ